MIIIVIIVTATIRGDKHAPASKDGEVAAEQGHPCVSCLYFYCALVLFSNSRSFVA